MDAIGIAPATADPSSCRDLHFLSQVPDSQPVAPASPAMPAARSGQSGASLTPVARDLPCGLDRSPRPHARDVEERAGSGAAFAAAPATVAGPSPTPLHVAGPVTPGPLPNGPAPPAPAEVAVPLARTSPLALTILQRPERRDDRGAPTAASRVSIPGRFASPPITMRRPRSGRPRANPGRWASSWQRLRSTSTRPCRLLGNDHDLSTSVPGEDVLPPRRPLLHRPGRRGEPKCRFCAPSV